MSQADTARAVYASVKAEVVERVKLRDQGLFIYLGAVGTVGGIALSTEGRLSLLLVLPYLTLGATVVVSQHHVFIGVLGQFVAMELHPFLERCGEAAPNWENSASFGEHLRKAIWKRAASHWVLIGLPPLASQAATWQIGFGGTTILRTLWWLGVVITLTSIGIMGRASFMRQELFDRVEWRSFDEDRGHTEPSVDR